MKKPDNYQMQSSRQNGYGKGGKRGTGTKGRSVGRIYYAHLASGQKYYMRLLLNVVKGCTSFEDIRKVNGVVYKSYKAACEALGFLDDDRLH